MAWSLVANPSKSSAGPTFTTSGVNTTGADLLIVFITSGSTTPSLSDSFSNTWTLIASITGSHGLSYLYYCSAPTVGAGHTFTTDKTNFGTITVQAWSGSAASPLDQFSSFGTSTTTTVQPGSITPLSNNELIICGSFSGLVAIAEPTVDSGFTIPAGSGFAGVPGTNYGGEALAYLEQTSAAAVNPTWTYASNTGDGQAIIASFKGAAGGGGGATLVRRTLSSLGTRSGSRQRQAA